IVVAQEAVDPRLPPKWRVAGVFTHDGAVAFADPAGRGGPVVRTASLGRTPLVAFFRFGTAQADRAYYLKDGPPGWAASVFVASLNGRPLAFAVGDGRFVETTTGSTFDFAGYGLSGPLTGLQ